MEVTEPTLILIASYCTVQHKNIPSVPDQSLTANVIFYISSDLESI